MTTEGTYVGYLDNVRDTASMEDVRSFLDQHFIKFDKLEPKMIGARFLGRVIVHCISHNNLLQFLKLHGKTFQGQNLKVFEKKEGGTRSYKKVGGSSPISPRPRPNPSSKEVGCSKGGSGCNGT
jgi:hypothetical protein